MSKFSDLLKKPLPSKELITDDDINHFLESAEEDLDEILMDDETGEEIVSEDDESDIDDSDINDITDDLSDDDDEESDDLDDLEKDLEDLDIEEIVGDVEEEDLSPEEEEEADDLMSLAATTELIQDEMNSDERSAFAESAEDIRIAISEGFLLESDIETIRENAEPFMESKMYAKTKVQFSKDARMKQLYGVAVNVSAKAHNSSDYFKYLKACKLKKIYKTRMQKKYHSEALKRMKVYFKRLKSSKSPMLSKLANKVVK